MYIEIGRSPRPSLKSATKQRWARGARRPPHLILRALRHVRRARAFRRKGPRAQHAASIESSSKGVCIISPTSSYPAPFSSFLSSPSDYFSSLSSLRGFFTPCGAGRRPFSIYRIRRNPWRNGDFVINRSGNRGEPRATEVRWRRAVVDTNGSLFIPAT